MRARRPDLIGGGVQLPIAPVLPAAVGGLAFGANLDDYAMPSEPTGSGMVATPSLGGASLLVQANEAKVRLREII